MRSVKGSSDNGCDEAARFSPPYRTGSILEAAHVHHCGRTSGQSKRGRHRLTSQKNSLPLSVTNHEIHVLSSSDAESSLRHDANNAATGKRICIFNHVDRFMTEMPPREPLRKHIKSHVPRDISVLDYCIAATLTRLVINIDMPRERTYLARVLRNRFIITSASFPGVHNGLDRSVRRWRLRHSPCT